MKLIRMKRYDGTYADVHPDMVENYRVGGFGEIDGGIQTETQAQTQAQTETPVKRKPGRPRKAN